ncbi:MAG: rod shape-determining protein MreC [Acutalibacteraceae bacterium]|nr:rod shape-determining protein MreC [Acutalibacteraceae bacterium]
MKETGNVKKVLATTFIVLLVVSAVSAALNKNFFTDVYTFVSSPFQQTAASLMSEYGQDASKTKEELLKENSELKKEVNELVSQVIDYDDIKKENEILRKYYGIKDDNPDYKIEVAAVIRRDPNDDYYGFTINKGSRNDVKLNDPVITENGLVGWISDVQVTTSRVTTLLSPEAKVGAMDKKSGDSGIATGSASYSDKGMLILSVISADNKIQENDIVITTGVGGVYPPDIVIGKVVDLDNDPYDTTPFAVLKPYEDLRSVSDVVVITSFDGQGVVEAVSSDKKATNDTARLKK